MKSEEPGFVEWFWGIIPTNNWIVLFHPLLKTLNNQGPFFIAQVNLFEFQSKYVKLLATKGLLYLEGGMAWLIPPLLQNLIIHLQYLVPTPFNLTCQVTSESLGFHYLGKTPFCQIFRGKSSLRMAKYIHMIINHVFYLKCPVDFFVCLQGYNSSKTKSRWKLTIPKSRNAIGDRTTHTLKFMTVTAPSRLFPWWSGGLIFMARGTKQLKGHRVTSPRLYVLPWIVSCPWIGCVMRLCWEGAMLERYLVSCWQVLAKILRYWEKRKWIARESAQ